MKKNENLFEIIKQVKIDNADVLLPIMVEDLGITDSFDGKRALCPFHGEKSPSFTYNEKEGHFKCFGCRKSCWDN